MERYGGRGLDRRPVVRNDMPSEIVKAITPSSRPVRLVFMGFLQADRPVEELITAVSLASTDVTLTLQGENRLGDAPQRLIDRLGLSGRVSILGPCHPTEVVQTASRYDIGVVPLRGIDENERRATTTKCFTYMSAGLVILGSNLPGIARVVNGHRNGILVDGMEPAAWAEAMNRLAAMPADELDAMKQRSLDAARTYAWDKQKPAFIGEFVRALAHEADGDTT